MFRVFYKFCMMSDPLKQYYLQQLGVEQWVPRAVSHLQNTASCSSDKETLLQTLAYEAATCCACPLHQTRTQTVFARGNPAAKLMVIGEAPGYYEDQQGKPFVGKAGVLLNLMLKSVGITDNQIYIANVLKCRPPNNRDPQPAEIQACTGFLKQQLQLIAPVLVLALGRFAGQFLAGTTASLSALRQKQHWYENIPFMVTYHPAYLLRNPKDKKQAWRDLMQVKIFLDTISTVN